MLDAVQLSGTAKNIQTKAIYNFPQFFRSGHTANYMPAKRIWNDREKIMRDIPGTGTKYGPVMNYVSAVYLYRLSPTVKNGEYLQSPARVVAVKRQHG